MTNAIMKWQSAFDLDLNMELFDMRFGLQIVD